jgi:hypothetical protein
MVIDGRIILMQILKKWDKRMWTGLNWLRTDSTGVLFPTR